MPIERIPTDSVPAHVSTGASTPVQTGVNTDTDTGAAITVDALGTVYVLVRRGTAESVWYRADAMTAAADFFGRLMSTDAWTDPDVLAQRVNEDETMCSVCWGIIAPEGATLVPEDGTPCTCNPAPLTWAEQVASDVLDIVDVDEHNIVVGDANAVRAAIITVLAGVVPTTPAEEV